MSNTNEVTISATMTEEQAEAMAQFFKRLSHHDILQLASNPDELERMKRAVNRIREGLDNAGFSPC